MFVNNSKIIIFIDENPTLVIFTLIKTTIPVMLVFYNKNNTMLISDQLKKFNIILL